MSCRNDPSSHCPTQRQRTPKERAVRGLKGAARQGDSSDRSGTFLHVPPASDSPAQEEGSRSNPGRDGAVMAAEVTRKTNKPLVERKRRERMKKCLDELKPIVASNMSGTRYQKLEKADVLEMVVHYIKSFQEFKDKSQVSADVTSKYQAGFLHCASEVEAFLKGEQCLPADLIERLSTHLTFIRPKYSKSYVPIAPSPPADLIRNTKGENSRPRSSCPIYLLVNSDTSPVACSSTTLTSLTLPTKSCPAENATVSLNATGLLQFPANIQFSFAIPEGFQYQKSSSGDSKHDASHLPKKDIYFRPWIQDGNKE